MIPRRQHARLPCPSGPPGVCSNSFALSVMPSNHLILCCSVLLLPSLFWSIRVFSNESTLHIRWPKYWSFSFSPSNDYSGLISFRIYWFDLLAVQETLKSLLQPQSSKASILWCSVFFGRILRRCIVGKMVIFMEILWVSRTYESGERRWGIFKGKKSMC